MRRAILAGLGSALLFGASTPCAKLLVGPIPPVLLAGLLYGASGLGLLAWLAGRAVLAPRRTSSRLAGRDLPALAGAIFLGGVAGPILLLAGLAHMPAATASLLLNLESLFTALLAWFAFGEHFDRRIACAMALIVSGGVVLSWQGGGAGAGWPALAIAGACLAWAIDNNLTRQVSGADPVKIAALKGIIAGAVNLALAWSFGAGWPPPARVAIAGLVGLVGYGVSLVLFVVALRELGAARTAAYFSTAPFIGAAVAVALLGERPNEWFWVAGALMAAGVWLHVAERHEHEHVHEPHRHDHPHTHDEHHRHAHDFPWRDVDSHAHPHVHDAVTHRHPQYPDLHHRHGHSDVHYGTAARKRRPHGSAGGAAAQACADTDFALRWILAQSGPSIGGFQFSRRARGGASGNRGWGPGSNARPTLETLHLLGPPTGTIRLPRPQDPPPWRNDHPCRKRIFPDCESIAARKPRRSCTLPGAGAAGCGSRCS